MRLLPHKLLDSALRWPDACAIQDHREGLTYAQLVQRASAIARWLQSSGIRPRDHVAVLGEASADYVASYFGVLLAGAVVMPLNAAALSSDLGNWIVHGNARALIVDADHPGAQALLPLLGTDVRVLVRDRGPIEGTSPATGDSAFRGSDPDPSQLAALFYTSGTTGRPKAVMLSHANLAGNAESIISYLQLTHADSIVSVLPFYYAYGSSILHTHIAVGARVVIEANLAYPHRVMENLARQSATGFAGVPSTFALLSARIVTGKYDLSALRYVTQAGGPMSPALTERVRAQFPGADLFVMYGQTEATSRLTYLPPQRLTAKVGSVGIAIPGVEIAIRSEGGDAVAPGVNGEVWARGVNIMLGYWKDEAATAAALVDGWLRTGDSGSLDDEGFLFLAGRRNDMIKVGAHRIFPREVEDVIDSLDGVLETGVVGVDDELLGQVIKACIVLAPGATVDEMTVKKHCRAHLAAYKNPKIVEFRQCLPKTAAGKLRRQLLVPQTLGEP